MPVSSLSYGSAEAGRVPAAWRRRLVAELRAAARACALTLAYQPRVRLADDSPAGAEALLRWPHPSRGLIPPSVFIPMAEESDLILELGGFALRQATAEAARWPGLCGKVSVNVSARQLQRGKLLQQVEQALEESGLPPERLELELTESLLVEGTAEAIATLTRLRDMGIGLALDDFGTGYACLTLLKRLPLSVLKVDRGFVAGLPGDAGDLAIVRALRDLTRALGLTMVAEGVETEAQRAMLTDLGCDEGQGYLFGRPGDAAAMRLS